VAYIFLSQVESTLVKSSRTQVRTSWAEPRFAWVGPK